MRILGKARWICISILAVLLTGCTNAIPDMSDEHLQMVEEYAAQLLLEYHAGYEASVLTEEEIAEEEADLIRRAEILAQIQAEREQDMAEAENDADGAAGEGDGNGEAEVVPEVLYTDIDEFFGLTDLEINFESIEVCRSYPTDTVDNDWQGMAMATGNNMLVAFEFSVANVSGSDYTLDMAQLDAGFALVINDEMTKSPLTTMLFNDFCMYRGVIPAGESITNVMLIELSEEDAAAITDVNLVMRMAGVRAETTLMQNGGF